MKRISMFLVLAFVLTAMVASANPFSDVPFSHWAYDAVNKLAAKGILQGYPDGTFKGEKHVTRYALAMVTAKMLANVEQMLEKGIGTNLVTKSDLQTLEKLTVEFADELALLGVKVTALEDDMQVVKEDVSTLKKDVEGIKDYMAKGGMEKVKLSGDMVVRHSALIHARDWNMNDGAPTAGLIADPRRGLSGTTGNQNNSQTLTQLRFQFKASIDENITAVARWHMLDKSDSQLGANNSSFGSWAYGNNGLGGVGAFGTQNNADASSNIDLAYLHIKDMFRFGGDFTFGRNFYATGHSLLLSDYVDAAKYYKRSGDIDIAFYSIYDRHTGSYQDARGALASGGGFYVNAAGVAMTPAASNPNDFRGVWGLTLGTKYHDHDLYLNFFGQEDPNRMGRAFGTNPMLNGTAMDPSTGLPYTMTPLGATTLDNRSNAVAAPANQTPFQSKDALIAIEFGGKGPLGRNGHWDYDLGLAYTGYQADLVQNTLAPVAGTNDTSTVVRGTAGYRGGNVSGAGAVVAPVVGTANNFSDVEMAGYFGTMGVKWDSKKEWAAKLGYTFGTDETVGPLSLNNDRRYDDGVETPYEDISRGSNYFRMGLVNMYDVKLQVEFRPRNTKHYFRLAGDFLDEMKDTVSNDMSRLAYGRHFPGVSDLEAGGTKTNTVYDRWNNFGVANPAATVFTFEYRYQLAENTRIRIGYTMFDMTGSAAKTQAVVFPNGQKVGRNLNGASDYDYNTAWAEIYSRF